MKKVSDILKEKAIGFAFNLVSLVVLVIILLLVIYAFAAFTEPTSAPSASNQDFAQNILGANNADNAFDSSAVTANNNGSIIERLEYLWSNRTSFGGGGVFTKCQTKFNSTPVYPTCPNGYSAIQNYASAKILKDTCESGNARIGFISDTTNDDTWHYDQWSTCRYNGTYACTVCEKD